MVPFTVALNVTVCPAWMVAEVGVRVTLEAGGCGFPVPSFPPPFPPPPMLPPPQATARISPSIATANQSDRTCNVATFYISWISGFAAAGFTWEANTPPAEPGLPRLVAA